MKLSKYFMMAAASLALFACSNDEDIPGLNGEGTKSVALKLEGIKSAPVTKGIGDGHSASTDVTLANVVVAFSDGTNFKKVQKFTTSSDDWDALTKAGGAGVIFHRLPNTVNEVYVIGNVYSSGETPKTEGIIPTENGIVSAWKNIVLDPKNEQNFNNVTVYGVSESFTPGTEPDDAKGEHSGVNTQYYTAKVTVKPLFARFEIGNIQCTNLGNTYTSLDLKVIGLFDTNTKMTIGGSLPSGNEFLSMANVNEPGTTGLKYTFGESTSDNAAVSWVWDKLTTASLTSNSTLYNPGESGDKKFVYQFIPNASTDGKNTQVKLYLEAKGGPAWNNSVVTASFKKTSDNETLESFEAGNIYTVDYKFTEGDIHPWNPDQEICINLSVTVAQWGIVALTPDFE